ncbi:apolipoprotein N-acyltransferase [Mycetocola manganoxydans]|uniref:Apolipoprotein N-acyltransferase n=1 Tax=Mycetocola manganoxydans TaxID=699879 RepID=A0A3L6ZWA6_9MICO|nr:apolipoprotein N-acyltransferase [Mycetocola manganoxydans]RLP71392.1 apolipoprotein N-acyltransferase [Mycetocola manganoxydans]GHD46208.1 apolipoprotein N-acyltransferase [Mycetocola manganoxydans]
MTTPTRPPLPLFAAVLVAAVAGPVLDAGFPDRGIWPLAFVGVALILVALIGRSAGGALLTGFIAGLSFYLIHVSWTALYLGPVPWVALSFLESIFFAGGALLLTLAFRWVPQVWPTPLGRIGLLPVTIAGLWTAREALVSTWPYGGFAWGRVALSQSESPFAPLVAWVGISGLSFLVVWLVIFIIQVLLEPEFAVPSIRLLAPAAAAALLLALPAWPVIERATSTIAAVQGNGKAGYFDEREPGDILAAQTSATLPLVGTPVDMIVWPENGSDLDPLAVPQAASILDYLATQTGAPLLIGTIQERDGRYFNTSLLWESGEGATDFYDKKHPVPFGEYVPDRDIWEPFAPDLIGMIDREYTPGTRDNVFDVNGVIVGLSICFDIVDDALTREAVDQGAQVIIAQTNNADFGRTDENQQQLAIARLRAIESSRSVVNVSTVGTSQIIGPDGATLTGIPAYTPGYMVQDVPLVAGKTPAMLIGGQVEALVSFFGLGSLAAALLLRPKRQEKLPLSDIGSRKSPSLTGAGALAAAGRR